ncbi:MAG TPA: TetR/AcrR family transcriptional regulator [Nocardioidaceae bacterium]|nr:TetR/AcrR family transcriptional regulator [Nocardioidaceae bacterium]
MRRQVTPADYFAAAMELLARGGQGSVKQADLCAALGVTTGSFYGHFANFDDFVRQLLDHWEATTFELIDATRFGGTPTERVRRLKQAGAALPHDAEGAIRSWARLNPVVAEVQARADTRRTAALYDVVLPIVGPDQAARMTTIGLTLLAGLHSLHSPVTREDFDAVFDVFEEQILARTVVG